MLLWNPMFASSLRLAISNPGFTFGFEPDLELTKCEKTGFIFLDLLFFLFHPIILKIRSSTLSQQQEAIKESRNVGLSEKFEKNLAKITKTDEEYHGYKKLELNFETIVQVILSLILYFYGVSETTTSNSLKALFHEDTTVRENKFDTDKFGKNSTFAEINEQWSDVSTFLNGIDPLYVISMNFAFSILSFTR